jgi:hypothetical protein
MRLIQGIKIKYLLVALAAVFSLMSIAAPAFAQRCGNKLVNVGDSSSKVLEYCGSPTWQDSWEEERLERPYAYPFSNSGNFVTGRSSIATVVHVTIEEWTYNFGPAHFMRILTFENGRVVNIKTGNYGF